MPVKVQYKRRIIGKPTPSETLGASPDWSRHSKPQRKFRWLVSLECGHEVQRRLSNFDVAQETCYCEFCADADGVAL